MGRNARRWMVRVTLASSLVCLGGCGEDPPVSKGPKKAAESAKVSSPQQSTPTESAGPSDGPGEAPSTAEAVAKAEPEAAEQPTVGTEPSAPAAPVEVAPPKPAELPPLDESEFKVVDVPLVRGGLEKSASCFGFRDDGRGVLFRFIKEGPKKKRIGIEYIASHPRPTRRKMMDVARDGAGRFWKARLEKFRGHVKFLHLRGCVPAREDSGVFGVAHHGEVVRVAAPGGRLVVAHGTKEPVVVRLLEVEGDVTEQISGVFMHPKRPSIFIAIDRREGESFSQDGTLVELDGLADMAVEPSDGIQLGGVGAPAAVAAVADDPTVEAEPVDTNPAAAAEGGSTGDGPDSEPNPNGEDEVAAGDVDPGSGGAGPDDSPSTGDPKNGAVAEDEVAAAPESAAPGDDEYETIPMDDEPDPADDEPAPADDEPDPADDEPDPADDEPDPADDEPAPADDEPDPADDESDPADDEPDPADDEPAPADDEPAPADDEPAQSTKVPRELAPEAVVVGDPTSEGAARTTLWFMGKDFLNDESPCVGFQRDGRGGFVKLRRFDRSAKEWLTVQLLSSDPAVPPQRLMTERRDRADSLRTKLRTLEGRLRPLQLTQCTEGTRRSDRLWFGAFRGKPVLIEVAGDGLVVTAQSGQARVAALLVPGEVITHVYQHPDLPVAMVLLGIGENSPLPQRAVLISIGYSG